ncbi:MAG: manganese efflux pump [Cellulosilyticaceae bacterium]
MFSIILLVFSLSIDAFVVSLAYGANKTKLSRLSKMIITFISSAVLIGSILIGNVIQAFIPHRVTVGICVFLLSFLGITRILEYIIKTDLTRRPDRTRKLEWSILNVQFNLQTTLPTPDPTAPQESGLSIKEACYLGLALSLDSIAVGIGIGLMSVSIIEILICSILMNLMMLTLGNLLGNHFAKKFSLNLGWLSGIILILLAFTKLT